MPLHKFDTLSVLTAIFFQLNLEP